MIKKIAMNSMQSHRESKTSFNGSTMDKRSTVGSCRQSTSVSSAKTRMGRPILNDEQQTVHGNTMQNSDQPARTALERTRISQDGLGVLNLTGDKNKIHRSYETGRLKSMMIT
jgi:hypothetical protein